MQQPTLSGVHVSSVQDVQLIFYAVYLGILPMISRRLDAQERSQLRSGSCYVWAQREEAGAITGPGIERFTEGRRWSASRVRDDFLFYYEKNEPKKSGKNKNNSHRLRIRSRGWDPLIKQTCSMHFHSPHGKRKWSLTHYFSQGTCDRLIPVKDIPDLRDIGPVPPGMFTIARTPKKGRRGATAPADEARSKSSIPSGDQNPPISLSENFINLTSARMQSHSLSVPFQWNTTENHFVYHYPPADETLYQEDQSHSFWSATTDENMRPLSTQLTYHNYPISVDLTVERTPNANSSWLSAHEGYVSSTAYHPIAPAPIQTTLQQHSYSVPSSPSVTGSELSYSSQGSEMSAAAGNFTFVQATAVLDVNYGPIGELEMDSDGDPIGHLAPLHALRRHHPYHRDPIDDRALQMLGSKRA